MGRGCDSGHMAFAYGTVMRGVDIDAHRDLVGHAVERGGHRSQALGQHARRSAVQHPVRLGIALDGHARNHALGRNLEVLDSQAIVERAVAEAGKVHDVGHDGDDIADAFVAVLLLA